VGQRGVTPLLPPELMLSFGHGLAAFEIRGSQIYPTVSAPSAFSYGLAAFEIRGSQIYPTVSTP